MLAQLVKYRTQQLDVLIPGATIHQHIIEEHDVTMVQQVGEQIVHHLHKCCWGICKPHWQTVHSYSPYQVWKAILATLSSTTQHCQYPLQRSNEVKHFALLRQSMRSLCCGSGYESLMVTLFKAQ